jgi:hypothetical protein
VSDRSNSSGSITARDRWQERWLQPSQHHSSGIDGVAGATAYRHDGLSVRAQDPGVRTALAKAIEDATAGTGCRFDLSAGAVRFIADDSGRLPDPFAVLRAVRRSENEHVRRSVGLDHLLSVAEQVGGNPFAVGHGEPGLDRYGVVATYQGRGPVALAGPEPRRRTSRYQPRVVVLDTGVGKHPWFDADPAITTVRLSDRTVGPQVDPGVSTEATTRTGALIDNAMLGTLGTDAGHGTFIAGLLRQACPEAEIVALAVMGADGIVPETTLADALSVVMQKQLEQPGWADAVVLSLGYYSEDVDDEKYNVRIKDILLDLGRAGVAVFCAAGNDATARPSYPAAFATDSAFTDHPAVVPLSSVAALNPNGSVAAFSNYGTWVTSSSLGVNVVSTIPIDADGSQSASYLLPSPGSRSRSALDPDNFTSGFASWSGTSFAAPILAGKYLSALCDVPGPISVGYRRQLIMAQRSIVGRS